MKPYHYILIRYSPKPAAGEFANVGIVLYTLDDGRFLFRLSDRRGRLRSFFRQFDASAFREQVRFLRGHLRALADEGGTPRNTVLLDVLRGLIRPNSNSFQLSDPMGGICVDAEVRISELFDEFIGRFEHRHARERVDERLLLHSVEDRLRDAGVLDEVRRDERIQIAEFEYTFKFAWQNGKRQVMEPISLDYLDGAEIVDKAMTWSGRLLNLQNHHNFQMTSVVAPPSSPELQGDFDDAVAILRRAPNMRRVLTEEQVKDYAEEIRDDLAHSH